MIIAFNPTVDFIIIDIGLRVFGGVMLQSLITLYHLILSHINNISDVSLN